MPRTNDALAVQHERAAQRMQVELLDRFAWYLHAPMLGEDVSRLRLFLRGAIHVLLVLALPWGIAWWHRGLAEVLCSIVVFGAITVALLAMLLRFVVRRGPARVALDSRAIVSFGSTLDLLAGLFFLMALPGSFVNVAFLGTALDPGVFAWTSFLLQNLLSVATLGTFDLLGLSFTSIEEGTFLARAFTFVLRIALASSIVSGLLDLRRRIGGGTFFVGDVRAARDEARAMRGIGRRVITRMQRLGVDGETLHTDTEVLGRVLDGPKSLYSVHAKHALERAAWEGRTARVHADGAVGLVDPDGVDVWQDRQGVPVLALRAPLAFTPVRYRFDAERRTLELEDDESRIHPLGVRFEEYLVPAWRDATRAAVVVLDEGTPILRADVANATGGTPPRRAHAYAPDTFQLLVTEDADVRVGLRHATNLDHETLAQIEFDRTFASLTAILRDGRRVDLGLRVKAPLDALLQEVDRIGVGRETPDGRIEGVILPMRQAGHPGARVPVL